MVTIRIADHVRYASTYGDGQAIYRLLLPALKNGDSVELSFEGFHAVPSAFVNAALIQLVEELPMDCIKAQLRITHSTKFINDLIRDRFSFVASQKQESDRSIARPGFPLPT